MRWPPRAGAAARGCLIFPADARFVQLGFMGFTVSRTDAMRGFYLAVWAFRPIDWRQYALLQAKKSRLYSGRRQPQTSSSILE